MAGLILMIIAALCFLFALIPIPVRVNMIALGLLFMALSFIVGSGRLL